MTDATAQDHAPSALGRAGLIAGLVVLAIVVAMFAGARFGLLLLIGVGYGVVLEGFRFGFAGPWRNMIVKRDPSGLLAHLLAIGIVALVAIPLLGSSEELRGAHAPVGLAMVGGAFVFGAAMQVVMGCGSGTLVNAGTGNPVSVVALPLFALGSFAGAYHLVWWTNLGSMPLVTFTGMGGLGITVVGLLSSAALLLWAARGSEWSMPRRYVWGAVALGALAIANFLVAGQPWGIVYGLGLWAAKTVQALGFDVTGSAFWGSTVNVERLQQSILTDYTSLTDLGIIAGAFFVVWWRRGLAQPLPDLPAKAWISTVIAGFLLGYSSRLAFGCNVGGFFSGISTGSLHGWAWFAAGYAGSVLGVWLRPRVGLG